MNIITTNTPKQNWLLVSDLDDTLLGDDNALERFRAFFDENQPGLDVIYASGRFCESIDKDVEKTALPTPVATIGGVGSEICKDKPQVVLADAPYADGVREGSEYWMERSSS